MRSLAWGSVVVPGSLGGCVGDGQHLSNRVANNKISKLTLKALFPISSRPTALIQTQRLSNRRRRHRGNLLLKRSPVLRQRVPMSSGTLPRICAKILAFRVLPKTTTCSARWRNNSHRRRLTS
ncbi:hypothetical protein D3C81_1872900 [compost metagenome]